MTARLLNPIVVACAAFVLSVAAAAGWFWLRADVLVAQALTIRRQHVAAAAEKVAARRAQGWDFWTVEVQNLESELKDQKLGLQKRADELNQREASIAAERRELERIRGEVQAMRQEIDDRVIAIKADENHNLRTLAQTYSNLNAQAAVAILREMDDITVVKILSLMKSDKVADIFAEMAATPTADGTLAKRAAVLSDKLRLMKTGQPAVATTSP
jgi:flagellar motility protein MotE (MotC chaperone)